MAATIRILLVDDDAGDAELVEREVRRADIVCTFLRVDTRDAMTKALREFAPDVILTDHSLPQFGGRDALLLAQRLSPGTPVIVVTGALGDELAVQYLQAGAADYIIKSHLDKLGSALLRALDTKRDREERARAHQLQGATFRVAQVALTTLGLHELFPAVHRIVGELMPADNFYVALYDPGSRVLSFPYFVDEHDTAFSPRTLGKGLTDYVVRTGRPLLVTPEVHADLKRRGEIELIGTPPINWIGVPLVTGGRVIGVLAAQTYSRDVRLGEREKEILQFVSTQVAMAIERSRAETEVRSSQARLTAIIDAALDAVITMDGDGVIRSWSPQAERMFGWPASDAVGRTLATTIVPVRYRAAHERGLARFVESGEGPVLNRRVEITGLHRDGREIPVELTITPVHLGGQWLFSAFVRDITERKQAERRRAAQYGVTRALAEAPTLVEAGVAILRAICESLDWQGGALWTVDTARDVLRCVEMWHPSDVELGEFERATRESVFPRDIGLPGRVWAGGAPIWHRDVSVLSGPIFPRASQATAAGLRGAIGFPIRSGTRITGVMEFFSRELREPDSDLLEMSAAIGSQFGQFIERKRAEEAFRESEERFREMAEHIKEAFFDVDLTTGKPLYVSPTWAEIWGRPLEESYDPGIWFQAIHPEDRPRLQASQEAVSRGEPSTDTFRILRPDGTTRWVRRRAFPVRDAAGRVHRLVGVAEDITEVRSTEEQLRQAQKMEAVGRLAGGIAHDFNNLLTVITSYSDLLLEDLAVGDPRRQDLEEIRKASAGAATLTRQLLAFSRQQVIEPKVLDLNALVSNAERLLKRLIGEDIALVTAPGRGLGAVRVDPGQLEQVIVNLAVNARDAMPQGGKLTIETANVQMDEAYVRDHPLARSGPYVMLAVSDTGVGMDERTQAHIFEPFFTTKEQGKGTGLGLATVYGIVKQSGGFIWVYSELGKGATFKVYLPRVDEPAEALPAPTGPRATPKGSETVLLVEDGAGVRAAARQVLERQGYTVLEAPNGEAALHIATKHHGPIDLLFTDVVMPEMSGRQLADQLGALRPELKVLYASGYTDDAIVRHGVLEPGIAFLQKPFTPDTLARKVRDVLDGR